MTFLHGKNHFKQRKIKLRIGLGINPNFADYMGSAIIGQKTAYYSKELNK